MLKKESLVIPIVAFLILPRPRLGSGLKRKKVISDLIMETLLKLRYTECLRRIFTWNMFRNKPCSHRSELDLTNMLDLARRFNNPQKCFPALHIAGTNGKGSVTLKCGQALSTLNMRVGIYTSPHISSFRERILVNQEMISVEDVVNYSEMVFKEVDSHKLDVTFFEIVTMIAFLHYREQKIDVAVLECGMGGRLDATNICESKTAAITSIGLDHCEILGATTDEICIEKCGIIRHGVTDVIIGPTVNANLV